MLHAETNNNRSIKPHITEVTYVEILEANKSCENRDIMRNNMK